MPLQDRLEPLLLDFRLLEMVQEHLLEFGMRGDFGHARQGLRELILNADQFLKLGDVHIAEICDLHGFLLCVFDEKALRGPLVPVRASGDWLSRRADAPVVQVTLTRPT
jgi:hypothetical protein